MKYIPSKNSQLKKRPYYELEEIEKICRDELNKVGLLPTSPEPIRIDRFIEKRFEINPIYEELKGNLLGCTIFSENGIEGILISSILDREGTDSAERRIRTTLAHEAGHILLHENYERSSLLTRLNLNLFKEKYHIQRILCRNIAGVSSNSGYNGDWKEFQANRAIGGLLMPRSLVYEALKPFTGEVGFFNRIELKTDKKEIAIGTLSEVFDVNPVVARIRIEEMFPLSNSKQLSL